MNQRQILTYLEWFEFDLICAWMEVVHDLFIHTHTYTQSHLISKLLRGLHLVKSRITMG